MLRMAAEPKPFSLRAREIRRHTLIWLCESGPPATDGGLDSSVRCAIEKSISKVDEIDKHRHLSLHRATESQFLDGASTPDPRVTGLCDGESRRRSDHRTTARGC